MSSALALGGTLTKYYYFGSRRVAMKRGSDPVIYLYGDHLGSTSVTADGNGTMTSRQTYYPFGRVRTTEGTVPTDYGFTGQRLDASTALMYYGARYYAAGIGRFVQPDSIIPNPYNPQSLNRYSYVLNNPLRYTDPSGHGVPDDIWAGLQQMWRMLTNSGYARSQGCGLNVDPSCGRAGVSPSVGGLLDTGEKFFREKNKVNFGPPGIDPADITDAAKRGADIAEAVGTVRRARDIRFTQDSIGSSTQEGVPLDDLSQEIAEGKLRGTIKVVEKDGRLYSLDNRRLAAAQLIDAELPVEVLDLNDPAVQQYFERHFTTENDGTSIGVRGTDIVIGPWDNDGKDLDDYYDDYD